MDGFSVNFLNIYSVNSGLIQWFENWIENEMVLWFTISQQGNKITFYSVTCELCAWYLGQLGHIVIFSNYITLTCIVSITSLDSLFAKQNNTMPTLSYYCNAFQSEISNGRLYPLSIHLIHLSIYMCLMNTLVNLT